MAKANGRDSVNRGRPSDPGLQSRFIEAALDLLEEQGYRALTTAAIAERAGASTASLYRRWPNKQALVSDIARTLTLDALGDIDTGSLEGDLREFIGRKRELIGRVGTPLLVLLAEATYDDELRNILRPAVVDTTTQHLSTMLERAAARDVSALPTLETVRSVSLLVIGGELMSHALPPGSGSGQDDLAIGAEVEMMIRVLCSPADAVTVEVTNGQGR